ncbi:hypothetical protein HDF18_11120 [Mucilaginibacter sp. X5P1]|uniref:hypothetical protein n=1 Tax=Mucilaginibacter sp. X5P1 TaxID=2723088 RepID=UPI0016081B31|nr:hypothetical protein [Mucilaginibacter sp. X5P1]MBB6140643.1 hypothetical protein [Mucilaginibacter sp. X5P1]
MKKYKLPAIILMLLIAACKPALKPENLYGTWKYIKVENPNETPPDSVSKSTLQEESPSIRFSKGDSLTIVWGGKILSHGTFVLDGINIRYTEILPGGKTRTFPFYVSEITDKELIFETLGEEGTRVTAVKE